RAVMKQQRYSPALELINSSEFFRDVLNHNISRGPIGSEEGKIPHEYRTILRCCRSITLCHDRNFVDVGPLGQEESDARRLRNDERCARRALALEALETFKSPVGGVSGLALFEDNFHAVDTTVPFVDEPVIVGLPISPGNP